MATARDEDSSESDRSTAMNSRRSSSLSVRLIERDTILFVAGLAVWVALHVLWVYTENVNWDEFALLARARESFVSGRLLAGGRPGLGTLVLVPFVESCTDVISAVRAARLAWIGFSAAILIALWMLLQTILPNRDDGGSGGAYGLLGVGLLALTPAFLRYSVQVRTDQPAVAFGLFGSVVLVKSRERRILALLAGILFGVGFLFSQKLVYVGALGGLLAAGETLINDRFRPGRDLSRAGLTLAGLLLTLFAFSQSVSAVFGDAPTIVASRQLDVFAYYRARGDVYDDYLRMAPQFVPHFLALFLIAAGAIRSRHQGNARASARFLLGIGVLALGIAVGWFHAGAFPYFWMTLGLFPAVGLTLAMPTADSAFRALHIRRLSLAVVWVFLLAISARAVVELSRDSQRIQRVSMRFIDANLSPEAKGFHPEKALLCRADSSPFPTLLTQNIAWTFYDNEAASDNRTEFMEQFRSLPVAFLLESWRLSLFPEEIRTFWSDHYVRYAPAVFVPGVEIQMPPGDSLRFETLVPGRYRWIPESPEDRNSVLIVGTSMSPENEVILEKQVYTVLPGADGAYGMLVLRLEADPDSNSIPFYKPF
jgi:hypothetical protein